MQARSGDLAKKMTFRALYRMQKEGTLTVPVIGVALDDWDDEALRQHAREAVEATVKGADAAALDAMLARLSYVQGDFADSATYDICSGTGYVTIGGGTAVDAVFRTSRV